MWIADKWADFEVLDTSDGEKLERWGKYILIRPDPQVIWNTPKVIKEWSRPSARYIRSNKGGGRWESFCLPQRWNIKYDNLVFNIKPMNFKHTGLFPEQAVNWDWAMDKIKNAGRPVKVLNLFAYTGGATVACAAAGAQVCHVDASKGMVTWAKENALSCGLADKPIRYIVDDCIKFVEREIRRGNRYDAVIMDPPSYGRGPGGEIWKLEEQLYSLLNLILGVMSDKPLFFLLNSYTTGLSPSVMEYLLGVTVVKKYGGNACASEIGLKVSQTCFVLPCGASARWQLTE